MSTPPMYYFFIFNIQYPLHPTNFPKLVIKDFIILEAHE